MNTLYLLMVNITICWAEAIIIYGVWKDIDILYMHVGTQVSTLIFAQNGRKGALSGEGPYKWALSSMYILYVKGYPKKVTNLMICKIFLKR